MEQTTAALSTLRDEEGWIKVSVALPVISGKYMVWTERMTRTGERPQWSFALFDAETQEWTPITGQGPYMIVTHWQPMPGKPSES